MKPLLVAALAISMGSAANAQTMSCAEISRLSREAPAGFAGVEATYKFSTSVDCSRRNEGSSKSFSCRWKPETRAKADALQAALAADLRKCLPDWEERNFNLGPSIANVILPLRKTVYVGHGALQGLAWEVALDEVTELGSAKRLSLSVSIRQLY